MRQFAVIVIVLFIAAAAYYFFAKPPQQLSVKDLHPMPARIEPVKDTAASISVPVSKPADSTPLIKPEVKPAAASAPVKPGKPAAADTKLAKPAAKIPRTPAEVIIATPATAGKYFYIIIESFKTIAPAKERAEKLKAKFHTDIIILPTPPEGYYRLSFGRYTTEDGARAVLPRVKSELKADAWILAKTE